MSVAEFDRLSLQGFTVRPAAMADLSAVINLLNTCSLASIGVRQFHEDEIRIIWETPGFSMETDTRIVRSPQGELIGYSDITRLFEPLVHPQIWGQVHPHWECQGIGTALMIWAQRRVREVISRVPEDTRISLMAYSVSNHEPSKTLFESLHMKPVRHRWRMVINLQSSPASPDWPRGIALRNYHHPQDAETVYRIEDEIFRDHWGYVQQPFESGYERWLHHATGRSDFDATLWKLAMDGKEVAGLLRCRPQGDLDPEMGWVSVLGVCRRWRGRGLGLALLQHAFSEFHRRGKKRVGLSVDAENTTGASRLYEKAGMYIEQQYTIYEIELRRGREIATQAIDS
ncbi:MAG TPA: GNAT family N-acetyltransferase [Anaerolineae bacterium]|nr:GNAT family N-acetyltransferase [Anaerolineae bacterium]